jgi:uncharacterized protein YcbK (DUF882 family)
MISRKITKNISFHELVPKQYLLGKESITDYDIRLLDIGLLNDIQKIRDYFGKPLTINDGKRFNWRGLRTKEYDKYNANSMHSWWRAYDFHIEGVPVEDIRQHIIDNRNTSYPSINAIEDDVNWIHVDSRYRPDGSLLVFKP